MQGRGPLLGARFATTHHILIASAIEETTRPGVDHLRNGPVIPLEDRLCDALGERRENEATERDDKCAI